MKRFNDEFYNSIIKLNSEGKNSKEIGNILNCSDKKVQRYLKSKNLNYTYLYSIREKNKCLNCGNECKVKFCNHSCAAIYTNRTNLSEERILKIEEKKRLTLKYKDYIGSDRIKKISEDKLLEEVFESIKDSGRIRKRILLEQDNKCNRCQNSHWFEQRLSLELEHKDGNNKNNSRENLEALCPNCHSLTKTWRGRNRKDLNERVITTREMLKDAYLENNKNIRQALLSLNIAAKGGNYQRMYDALNSYDIIYVKQSKTTAKEKQNKFV